MGNLILQKFREFCLVYLVFISTNSSVETLQTNLINRIVKISIHAHSLQVSHLDRCKDQLSAGEQVLRLVNPLADQNLFIEYNIRAFTAPNNRVFEPCSSHYDTVSLISANLMRFIKKSRRTK